MIELVIVLQIVNVLIVNIGIIGIDEGRVWNGHICNIWFNLGAVLSFIDVLQAIILPLMELVVVVCAIGELTVLPEVKMTLRHI